MKNELIILKIVNEWGNAKYGMEDFVKWLEESRELPTVEECLRQIHWPDFEPYQKKLITDLIIFAQTTKS